METIILNYNEKKKDLINKIVKKFSITKGNEDYLAKQLEYIIENTLSPSNTGVFMHKHKAEVFKDVKDAFQSLEDQLAKLKSEGAQERTYHSDFNLDFVKKVESLMIATSKFKNNYRNIIKQLRDPLAIELTLNEFNKALAITCEYTRIETSHLLKPCRKREVYDARKLFVISLFCYYSTTLSAVGRYLGKNHATILHYIEDKKMRQYDNKKKKTRAV
jgi:chromosomal replication initiation ATPase DnaA